MYHRDNAEAKLELDNVKVIHSGWTPHQNFSSGLVDAGLREGWISLSKGKITLHTRPEELIYTIDRTPGRYCCHCDEKLPDDATGEMARSHVAAEHEGEKSPDPQNPSGYCMLNHYACTIAPELHKRWALSKNDQGHLMQNGKRYKEGRQIG